MGTNENRRRKGQGGLYKIRKPGWNEVTQQIEELDFYQATKEVVDPNNPSKRKKVYGTAQSPEMAISRLNKNHERYLTKTGLQKLGVQVKASQYGSQSVSEYLEQWHSELRDSQVSPQLKYKYRGHIKNHLSPHMDKIKLQNLNYQDLEKLFYETLPAKRKTRGQGAGEEPLLGSNGLLNVYKTLSIALKVAVKKEKILKNPLELVKAPTYQAPKENIPQLMHIAEHIFKKMNDVQDPLFDHFLLALLGLRKGERLGLTFSNLVLTGPNPKLKISTQLSRITGQGLVLKKATKSGKDRTVSIQEPWLSSLKRLKAKRKEQLMDPTFQPQDNFNDLVFLKDNGKPYDLNEDNEMWLEVNRVYNSKHEPLRGHSLRHISATKMADSGVDREVAMAILGHESEAMSHYYGRITAKRQSGQVERFGESLSQKILG
jgi:integrase